MTDRVDGALYNQDYFENGIALGISGYFNYTWLPEKTIRMVVYLIRELGISPQDVVLDFGCAKGYVVKAFRILDFAAFGVDVSDYAIHHVDSEVRDYCARINGVEDPTLFARVYDWLIAKDTFEHMTGEEVAALLRHARSHVRHVFAVIPLGKDDVGGGFVVPDYDRDVTHITARTAAWWTSLFVREGWHIKELKFAWAGCKEDWTKKWPDGNAFFVLTPES